MPGANQQRTTEGVVPRLVPSDLAEGDPVRILTRNDPDHIGVIEKIYPDDPWRASAGPWAVVKFPDGHLCAYGLRWLAHEH